MNEKLDKGFAINPSTAIKSSTELECPDSNCDSKLFFPTIRVRKISALLTETGKPGAFTVAGPLLCAKCRRELEDADFGYTSDEPEDNNGGDQTDDSPDLKNI
ncbi:hypothetical protein LCGC14_1825350 [marine sediment metagenome]|uniref:Uncharacterized protein n=1 Tax=marine sediment metagenome TaxID=412755 RepID=A0A0F9JH88_9ZZZZ